MNSTPEPPQPDLDATTVEAVLTGSRPSGDSALDATLDGLRALVTTAPEPTGELTRLLGPVILATSGDELGRRRQSGARHVATGTTVVAGILLASATAAAAIGGLGAGEHTAPPTSPPAVVAPETALTPHPVDTTPSRLPILPAFVPDATHETSDPAMVGHHDTSGKPAFGTAAASARHGDDSDSTGVPEPGEAGDAGHEGPTERSTRPSSGPTDEDEGSSGSGPGTSTSTSTGTSTSDDGGDGSDPSPGGDGSSD